MQNNTSFTNGMKSAAKLSEGNENIIFENIDKLNPATSIELSEENEANKSDKNVLRTAPVAGLQPFILNEDSLKNGQITTDTQIAWLWNFSDEDGDTLLNRYLGGFPSAYYL